MRKLCYEVIIDDFQNKGCSEVEKKALMEVYKSITKYMSISLAREAHYELKDFSYSKESGIDQFTLVTKRSKLEESEYFVGEFKSGEKYLEVTAYLMKAS